MPSEDPNDPLQWSNARKTSILIICAVYSFLGNSALVGPSVYINTYSEEFGITSNEASGLISYANLAFGFGSLILVPLYHKVGRRPVMLGSLIFVRPPSGIHLSALAHTNTVLRRPDRKFPVPLV